MSQDTRQLSSVWSMVHIYQSIGCDGAPGVEVRLQAWPLTIGVGTVVQLCHGLQLGEGADIANLQAAG
jgi:hypothetical protein